MNIDEARVLLKENGQSHVLNFHDQLDASRQQSLLRQIAELDFSSIRRMWAMLKSTSGEDENFPQSQPTPPDVMQLTDEQREAASAAGDKVLSKAEVGVLLVAGGQGSRLGYDGPKGAFSVGPISGASLFYFHARKVLSLSRRYGVHIPLYIMTSELNDAATRSHFEQHAFFGLDPQDVIFFTQNMWPALDPAGRIMMDRPDHIFMSPDGHGGTLSALHRRGCLDDMERRGISTIFYLQVDNPLVEIADPAFVGVHAEQQADFSVKLCTKRAAREGMGVVVERDGHYEMVEYSEFDKPENHCLTALNQSGELIFKFGSVAIHIFSYEFLKQEALRDMPLHIAHKKIPVCNAHGETLIPTEPNGFKFEKFIFDVLPDAGKVVNLAFERADEFSPVKNADGDDSPATCRRDLQLKWLRWLQAQGVTAELNFEGLPLLPIEIDPAYALNADDLKERGFLLRDFSAPPVYDASVK